MPEQQLVLSPRHGRPTSMQPYWLKTSGGSVNGGGVMGGWDFFLRLRFLPFLCLVLTATASDSRRAPRPRPALVNPRSTSRREGRRLKVRVTTSKLGWFMVFSSFFSTRRLRRSRSLRNAANISPALAGGGNQL